ncbi:MAG: hypothetical protein K0S33_1052 [Bacteroidetes bacterium]|jgi:hypothetical protein|nr:hypothetical protein [Bacteroidota bacterium]
MKQAVISTLLLLAFQAFGQKSGPAWHLKGQTKDGTVKAYLMWNDIGGHEEYLVYKKENRADTLAFCDYFYDLYPDTFMLKSIQIDGKGLKEIVVSWSLQYSDSMNKGKAIKRSLTFNEIWDPDSRKKIFSAQNSFYEHHVFASTFADKHPSDTLRDTITCSYRYDFSVDSQGQITIKNTKKNFKPVNVCKQPDNEEGVYLFKNGEYVLTKKISKTTKQ